MTRIPITKTGFEKMKKELENLRTVSVPENIRDIETARAHGDLSENAEYAAAKERQSFIHGRIKELENNLALSDIIDLKNMNVEKVVFGCMVSIEDTSTGKDIQYQLVGPFESDINVNKISVTSPIGKALIGKCIGDLINVQAPGGAREFEIIDISVAGEE